MANDEYREPQQDAREVGLRARHETRLRRAIRREVADEIADMTLSARHADCAEEGRQPCPVCWALGEIASKSREIGSKGGSDD
jgi:hypothetical protein